MGDASVKVTVRLGPPILGRGYMEAVADSEIDTFVAGFAVPEPLAEAAVDAETARPR